jgi:CRP/FNR family transcriptional regulator
MPISIEVLKGNQLFGGLSPEELERMSKMIFSRGYKAGRVLFFENTPGEVMYLVQSGQVGIYKTGADRKELLLATIGPGSFFGEMSLLDDQPRSATAKIVEDAELVVITKKAFEQMLETDPGITSKLLIALLKAVFQRLRATDEKFKNLISSG